MYENDGRSTEFHTLVAWILVASQAAAAELIGTARMCTAERAIIALAFKVIATQVAGTQHLVTDGTRQMFVNWFTSRRLPLGRRTLSKYGAIARAKRVYREGIALAQCN